MPADLIISTTRPRCASAPSDRCGGEDISVPGRIPRMGSGALYDEKNGCCSCWPRLNIPWTFRIRHRSPWEDISYREHGGHLQQPEETRTAQDLQPSLCRQVEPGALREFQGTAGASFFCKGRNRHRKHANLIAQLHNPFSIIWPTASSTARSSTSAALGRATATCAGSCGGVLGEIIGARAD